MLATFVNCITVILGTFLGILFSRKVTEELSRVISSGAGIVTLVIGLQMALETNEIIFMVLAMILGGIIGTWIDIDGKILKIGEKLSTKFSKGSSSNFANAFLNASVLFCVGAMAIVGSFKAGTEGDYSILLTKSVLDGFMAIVFAAAMGIGTAFSAISLLVYQGLLTLLSGVIKDFVNPEMLNELSAVGGALIIMIGINLLDIKKLKTANYLPALIFTVIFILCKEPVLSLIK